MIRHSPAELYIKYLVCHPDGYGTDAVRDIVRGQGLDYPSDDYVDRMRDRLAPRIPVPFQPANKRHSRSSKFLTRERLMGFFRPDKPSQLAHKLLAQPRAKEAIEAMTLSGEAPAFVSHRVKMLGCRSTPEAIKRYCAFYWDLKLVDSTEVRALLDMRTRYLTHTRTGHVSPPDQRLQHAALKNAQYKDPRRMIAEMPVTPVAGMLGQMRLGLMPSQVDLAKIAVAARAASAGRVLESAVIGGRGDAARARDWSLVSKMMSELIIDIGSPDVELQKELQKLALTMEDGDVPHIGELPEGDTYTLDVMPATTDKEKVGVIDTEESE